MKKALSYLKPYWWLVALAIGLVIIQTMVELQLPALMARIVDEGIVPQNMDAVWQHGQRMIIYTLIDVVLAVLGVILATLVSIRYGRDLRKGLFAKIQTLSFKNVDQFKTGGLITRLTSDVNQIQSSVQFVLRMAVVSLMLMIGSLVIAISLNPRLSMIYLVAIPVLLIMIIILMRKVVPIFGQVQKTTDQINTVLQENFSGARVVRAYDRADYENKRFNGPNRRMYNLNMKIAKLMALTQPLMMLVMNMTMIAIVWFGGWMMTEATVQVGQVMAMINYSMQILFSLLMASFVVMMIFRARISVVRINEVLRVRPDIETAKNVQCRAVARGEVQFRDVDFKYKTSDEELVLKDVNLTIAPQETVAIMGPTGSGKSSLINLIGRFYEVDNGDVLIDGVNVKDYDLDCLRAGMAVVNQAPTLFSGTIKANIKWGKNDATDAEIKTALKLAQAWEFVSKDTKGIEAEVKQKGTNFSGGQKQRLAIARALVRKPRILILDDATSALDLATEAKVRAAIQKQENRPTTIIIAQRIVSAMSADRIVLLDESGRIEAIGPHKELMKKSKTYQEIYQSQLNKGEMGKAAEDNEKGGQYAT